MLINILFKFMYNYKLCVFIFKCRCVDIKPEILVSAIECFTEKKKINIAYIGIKL